MISYNPKSWITFIFSLHKADTIRMMWKQLLYIGALTAFITFIQLHFFKDSAVLKNLTSVYSLLGFVISLLLVFRTNTAYDRWWEGRKQWGSIVNDSRNLTSLLAVLPLSILEKQYYAEGITSLSKAIKEHLRRKKVHFSNAFVDSEHAHHQALYIAQELRKSMQKLYDDERIDTIQLQSLNRHLSQIIDCMGACERILNTPIPYSYSIFFKKFIFIYVVTMPLAFVELFGYWSALISTFVFYALVSMELLAEEIEDPFGTDDNDLPLDAICKNIDKNVKELLLDEK